MLGFKVLRDPLQFQEIVGLPVVYEAFNTLPIKPNSFSGAFAKNRINELLEFCAKNSDYSIVSILPNLVKLNGVSQLANTFRLVKGGNKYAKVACDLCGCVPGDQISTLELGSPIEERCD